MSTSLEEMLELFAFIHVDTFPSPKIHSVYRYRIKKKMNSVTFNLNNVFMQTE